MTQGTQAPPRLRPVPVQPCSLGFRIGRWHQLVEDDLVALLRTRPLLQQEPVAADRE